MALQTFGTISLGDVAAEYGGSVPHRLGEYYRGQGNVPTTVQNAYTGYDPYAGYSAGTYGVKRRVMTSGSNSGTVTWEWWWNSVLVSTTAPDSNNLTTVGTAFYQVVSSSTTSLGSGTDKNGDSYSELGYPIGKYRTTYTTVSANTNVPSTVGDTISLDDFYGGRNT